MRNKFIAAAVQMNCVPGEVEQNLSVAAKMIREAADKNAVLIVVPELFDTGYRVEEKDFDIATGIPGPTTDFLHAICRERNIFVVGTIIEKKDSRLYDTAILVGPGGVVGTYRKNALWGTESSRFLKGSYEYPVYDIGFCKVGLQICYEIGFPEGARILTLQGADVVAYPSAFGAARSYAWDLASRSRALENGNYVIACNRTGVEKVETVFGGGSRIVNPRGDILALASNEYEIITAEIDLDFIKAQREAIPYLKDLNCGEISKYYAMG